MIHGLRLYLTLWYQRGEGGVVVLDHGFVCGGGGGRSCLFGADLVRRGRRSDRPRIVSVIIVGKRWIAYGHIGRVQGRLIGD